jgi:hypothetical protein
MDRAQTIRRRTSRTEEGAIDSMPEFKLPLGPRDEGWIDLRDRLARTARELHFVAVASESADGSSILMIAGRFAELAMSIPMRPEEKPAGVPSTGALVNASTLYAAQVQQYGHDAHRDDVLSDVKAEV